MSVLYARFRNNCSNLNILLYGNETLVYQIDIELFSAVHEYIKNTKRFDNT